MAQIYPNSVFLHYISPFLRKGVKKLFLGNVLTQTKNSYINVRYIFLECANMAFHCDHQFASTYYGKTVAPCRKRYILHKLASGGMYYIIIIIT